MHIKSFQDQIKRIYGEKDEARGVEGTFMWFLAEVGELAAALREEDKGAISEELGDVLAWLVTVANVVDVDLEAACQKYAQACNKCSQTPCVCRNKP